MEDACAISDEVPVERIMVRLCSNMYSSFIFVHLHHLVTADTYHKEEKKDVDTEECLCLS